MARSLFLVPNRICANLQFETGSEAINMIFRGKMNEYSNKHQNVDVSLISLIYDMTKSQCFLCRSSKEVN